MTREGKVIKNANKVLYNPSSKIATFFTYGKEIFTDKDVYSVIFNEAGFLKPSSFSSENYSFNSLNLFSCFPVEIMAEMPGKFYQCYYNRPGRETVKFLRETGFSKVFSGKKGDITGVVGINFDPFKKTLTYKTVVEKKSLSGVEKVFTEGILPFGYCELNHNSVVLNSQTHQNFVLKQVDGRVIVMV